MESVYQHAFAKRPTFELSGSDRPAGGSPFERTVRCVVLTIPGHGTLTTGG